MSRIRTKNILAGLALSLLSACGAAVTPRPQPVPSAPQPPGPLFASFCAAPTVHDAAGHGIAGATVAIGGVTGTTNADGYRYLLNVPAGEQTLTVLADGFTPYAGTYAIDSWACDLPITLTASHVDPSTIPLEQLAAIKGAMWTARINVPQGPRPNDPSNILAMPFYGTYDRATKDRMRAAYKAHGYTHAVTGPVTGNDCYHGLYACRQGIPSQAEWDAYLDELQEWWDDGIVPVYFSKPDGINDPDDSTIAALDALYQQPRAQQLLRVVVYTGWEPWHYELTNAQWVRWLARGAIVFPQSLRLVHTVADVDALTGGNDDQTFPAGEGNARSWQNAAPYLHGWLMQNWGYMAGGQEVPQQGFRVEFLKQFDANFNASIVNRFRQGYAGWPRSSAWGDGKPLRVYAAEFAAYGDFWWNWAERYAIELGDAAMRAGADGYLDGGSVPVEVR